MSIKTNSLDYVIDKQKIEEKYDIFCLETSEKYIKRGAYICLLYTSPSPRDRTRSRIPSSA